MKKNLLALSLLTLGLSINAQTTRMSLFEEFTGETCPPCASTNPGLNQILLSPTNASKIIAIKWQVPIPSVPAATWSLYKTNQAEIDWRYQSPASGGYGYASQTNSSSAVASQGVNSAPSGRIDGQHQWVFGAPSDHPAYISNGVIATAQSYTSAFSITMNRAWNATGTAITLTINVTATAPFTAVGPLVFRTVMVERLIQFSVQPGTNGEKTFEDVAIKSFPSIQTGVAMAGTWTVGQSQTFTLNCPIPSYTRKKEEIAFVGFIQDDGNQKVAQAARADKEAMTNDAVAIGLKVPVTCNTNVTAEVAVYNNGADPITAMTITPFSDAVAGPVTNWTGNLAPGASVSIVLNPIPAGTTAGQHNFTYTITALNATDFNMANNSGKTTYVSASSYLGNPVAESFSVTAFPPAGFSVVNPNNGVPNWTRSANVGAYALTPLHSTRYNFYDNTVIGDQDELYLPPMDLYGTSDPDMSFDLAYARKDEDSDDALDVFASSDCGATWTNVYHSNGASMATGADVTAGFVPTAGEWRTEVFTLPGFNKSNVLVKFVVTNDNGNYLYLDNINLAQAAPVGITKINASNVSVSLYPNPTNGVTSVNITSKKVTEAKISVVNQLGQVIVVKTARLAEGANSVEIDTKEFAAGIYNVTISTADGSAVKKLNVIK